jgi:glycosyltransferase involved in cell wall biosynthesis
VTADSTTVLLDARLGRKLTGIGLYVVNLLHELAPRSDAAVRPICRRHHTRRYRRLGLQPWVAPIRGELDAASLPPAQVVHGPNFHAPPHPRASAVATIHDLGYLRLPECHPPGMPERLDRLVRASLGRTALYLCDSASTRDDFLDAYGVAPERCRVVHLGVSERFSAVRDEAGERRVRRRHRLCRPYLLHVGAMVPRKDLPTLVAAFRLLRADFPDLDLVLAGNKTRRWATDWPKVKALLDRDRRLARHVRVLNYVRRADLPDLYRAAEACVLASRWEGFGLTVLEGLACGRPVVATRTSSIPEIGGAAVLYAEPRSPDAFAAAVTEALTDAAGRERRAREGLEIAARLTWRATAEATAKAYRDAAAGA